MLADSGAYNNLIDEGTWEQLKAKHIKCTSNAVPQNKRIYAYASDKPLEIKGTFECEVRAGKGIEKAEFVVVGGRCCGGSTCFKHHERNRCVMRLVF